MINNIINDFNHPNVKSLFRIRNIERFILPGFSGNKNTNGS